MFEDDGQMERACIELRRFFNCKLQLSCDRLIVDATAEKRGNRERRLNVVKVSEWP